MNSNKIVFIGGMGRSGTHYIGRLLGEHPKVNLRLESRFTFWPITNYVAYNKAKAKKPGFNRAVLYLKGIVRLDPRTVVEKTHPSIWAAEELLMHFPNARWICVERDPYQSIASMLKHSGVQKWYDRVDESTPNPFLGITDLNKSFFSNLSLVEKGAYKWVAHTNQMNYLKDRYGNQVLMIRYDDLVLNQIETLQEVYGFLNLAFQSPQERGKVQSLKKKNVLTKVDVVKINEVLALSNLNEWTSLAPQ